jgi:hypothetical protein
MAKYSGSGWHRQSIRHSNARKYGRAGGEYSLQKNKYLVQPPTGSHEFLGGYKIIKNEEEKIFDLPEKTIEEIKGLTQNEKNILKNLNYEFYESQNIWGVKKGDTKYVMLATGLSRKKSDELIMKVLNKLEEKTKTKKNYGRAFNIKYKGKMIEAEKEETKYFSSYYTYPKSEAVKYAEEEMKKNPILTRYEITEHSFQPTSAYPKGKHYEVNFYYHRPTNQYFDYGTDVAGAKEYLAEFQKNKDKPLSTYAISSVERNMTHSGLMGALETIKANKKTKNKIEKIFEKRESLTPYTNWSGD